MSGDERTLIEAAKSLGIELSEEQVEGYLESVHASREMAARLRPSSPQGQAPADITEGDDRYNAFRYRIEATSGEGPLAGLEVAVKDNMTVAGVPMTCGSAAVSFVPEYDATVVTRLRDAGAALVGTTNMDEFALFTTGETCAHGPIDNPVAPDRVPGGSSSGSAAAVASEMVDAALGSDTGGSIRIPASFCGIVGLKPTHRQVPRFGFADLSPTLDHIGPLARDVETTFRVFDAIAGPDPNDPSSILARRPENRTVEAARDPAEGFTVGLIEESIEIATDEVGAVVTEATERLGDAGMQVRSVSLPSLPDVTDAVLGISGPEFSKLFENGGQVYGTGTGYSDTWREAVHSIDGAKLGGGVLETVLVNNLILDETNDRIYVGAQNFRREWMQAVSETFSRVDAIVTPTTPMTPPEFGTVHGTEGLAETIALTSPFNLTGHPALSVPCGQVGGQPIGLQVVSDWFEESTLAGLGTIVERTVS